MLKKHSTLCYMSKCVFDFIRDKNFFKTGFDGLFL